LVRVTIDTSETEMLGALIVVLAILFAFASALRSGGRGEIAPHPYSDPYSDASGAREEQLR
jgi:hypothetical protein